MSDELRSMLENIRKRVEREYTGKNDLTIRKRYERRLEKIYEAGLPQYSVVAISHLAHDTLDQWMSYFWR